MKKVIACLLLCVGFVSAAVAPDVFYVYSDRGDPRNHYYPSGFMGDYGDLKIDTGSTENPQSGKTCIKWTYTGERKQGAGWAGCFWQAPANNWGEKKGGYNLSAYTKLTFWARGSKGEEIINEFKVGGITGDNGDTDAMSIGPITLTKEWKQYTIDLTGKQLTNIIGGFAWSAPGDLNPGGFTMYLDEIEYQK